MKFFNDASLKIFYTLAFSHPSIDTIVLWALSDKGSWRNFPAGVFDDKGRPKLIYKTLNDLIHKKWNTHVKGKIRENGKVPLHGFLGEYEITTTYEGKTHKGYFSLNKDQGDSVEVFLQ